MTKLQKGHNGKKEKSKLGYFFVYTVLWLFLMGLWLLFFASDGKSFIWKADALHQHWNTLVYWGEYLREFFHNLFVNHTLSLPMFDLKLGAGSDLLTTLHYYVIGDPLNLLSVFVPPAYTEYLYMGLIALRCYLSGAFFSCYCFYHKHSRRAVLSGSLIYAFCGYQIVAATTHHYFINPMLYLPLLLLGIDKIYKKEKPYLFIITTAVAAMSNFYFFYMLAVFMFLYAAFRYFMHREQAENRLRMSLQSLKEVTADIVRWFFRFLGYFLVGLCMAAVIFLPVVMTLLGTDRFSVSSFVPAFYEKYHYRNFLAYINSASQDGGYWLYMGFAAFAVLAVLLLAVKKKNRREKYLLAGVIMMLVFSLIPFFGHVFNGFSYVSNRWNWAFAMLVACVFVNIYPIFFQLGKKEKIKLAVLTLLYVAASLILPDKNAGNVAALLLLLASAFLVIGCGWFYHSRKFLHLMILLCVMVQSAAGLYFRFSPGYTDISYFADMGRVAKTFEAGQTENLVARIEDDSFWRYDEQNGGWNNAPIHYKVNGIQFYYSLANPVLEQFLGDMWQNVAVGQKYRNLDERTILEMLFSVKYFAVEKGKEHYVPSAYSRKVMENEDTVIYENPQSFPLAYTYDRAINGEVYDKMTVTEKQQALLQGAVVSGSSLPTCQPVFSDKEYAYTTGTEGGIEAEERNWTVRDTAGSVTLTLPEIPGDGEVYLLFENLRYTGYLESESYGEEAWAALTDRQKRDIKERDEYTVNNSGGFITVSTGNMSKQIEVRNNKYSFYCGRHDFLCNLGEDQVTDGQIRLSFSEKGTYTFDKLTIVNQPLDDAAKYAEARRENPLEHSVVDYNYITGGITLDTEKILCFSIPYSQGWTAYVDGKKTDIIKTNTAFLGLELGAGTHEIRLVYRTPYLAAGAILSLLGCILLAGIAVHNKMKCKRKMK